MDWSPSRNRTLPRRELLTTVGIGITSATAGCLENADWLSTGEPQTETATPTEDQHTMAEGTILVKVTVRSTAPAAVLETGCRSDVLEIEPGESEAIERVTDGESCGIELTVDGESIFDAYVYEYESLRLTVTSEGDVETESIML